MDIGSDLKVVDKTGAWYAFNDERIGQGRENAKSFLKAHPEVAGQIEEQIRAKYLGGPVGLSGPGDDND